MGVNAVAAWLNHLGNGSFSMSDTLNWHRLAMFNYVQMSFLKIIGIVI